MQWIWKILCKPNYGDAFTVYVVACTHDVAIERALVWAYKEHRYTRQKVAVVFVERQELRVFV